MVLVFLRNPCTTKISKSYDFSFRTELFGYTFLSLFLGFCHFWPSRCPKRALFGTFGYPEACFFDPRKPIFLQTFGPFLIIFGHFLINFEMTFSDFLTVLRLFVIFKPLKTLQNVVFPLFDDFSCFWHFWPSPCRKMAFFDPLGHPGPCFFDPQKPIFLQTFDPFLTLFWPFLTIFLISFWVTFWQFLPVLRLSADF